MKIYTRTGDKGHTGVIGGRVRKDDLQVEAYGTVDELNSFVGVAMAGMDEVKFADMLEDLLNIQHELFDCGSDLAILDKAKREYKVTADMAEKLEALIDKYDAETPDITRFILPGGSASSAALHVCRTVCRRAERRVVTLAERQDINEHVRTYLNRLSDLFFTIARTANFREGRTDVEYARSAEVFRRKSDR
ncbi:cob(I)yrinic acid a,c-diamide adenosyltransferase [Paenibacillus antri]|uniref:Corrinoid adenosyltransferase n=1 Tax=Paenibacillus antri TaxID=2582848 RepID=A0A5R9GE37_9BACL|nr:cob(I)yrinic acid a,c-diamide adenosyltransferase [Paenibacillus antri]TLS51474.1 cob(I)yrinic acid a,c-diamide adenosyltransferase [Paenibacillus antri]